MEKVIFSKEEVLRLLKEGNTIRQVASRLGHSYGTTQKFIKENGMHSTYRYSPLLKAKVTNMFYDGKTCREISKELHISYVQACSIIKNAQMHGKPLKNDKNTIGINLFSAENRFLLWYLIGFISADGHLKKNSKGDILLCQKDFDLINNIKDKIHHTGKLYYKKTSDIYYLSLYSPELYNYLKDRGFNSNKSYDVPWLEECPIDCLPFYIRGYFDGDGCLYYKYENNIFSHLDLSFTSGSEILISKLKIVLENLSIVSRINIRKSSAGNNVYVLYISSKSSLLRLCEFMYNSSLDLKLEYKHQKYLNILNIINNEES